MSQPPTTIQRPAPRRVAAPSSLLRSPLFATALVAGLFLLIELVSPLSRMHLAVDESMYLSQVTPGEVARYMHVHRARGTSLLVAPIAWLVDDHMLILRTWLALLAAGGLYVAFRPWTKLIGWTAPLAAVLFSTFWVTLLFGSQLYPNFPVALAAVAAAGHLLLYLRDERRIDALAAGVGVAAMALLRPLDTLLIGAALGLAVVLFNRRLIFRAGAVLALGALAGMAPYFIETWIRFGYSPVTALFRAKVEGAGVVEVPTAALYLERLEAGIHCTADCKEAYLADPRITVHWRAASLVIGTIAAAAIGVVRRVRSFHDAAIITAGLAAAAHLAYYLTCTCAINLRYLLPGYAFVAILMAAGLVRVWQWLQGRGFVRTAQIGTVTVAVLWATYQTTLASFQWPQEGYRERGYLMAQELDARLPAGPCFVGTNANNVQVEYYSRCRTALLWGVYGEDFLGDGPEPFALDVEELAAQGYNVYAFLPPDWPSADSRYRQWPAESVDLGRFGEWLLYRGPQAAGP